MLMLIFPFLYVSFFSERKHDCLFLSLSGSIWEENISSFGLNPCSLLS